MKAHVYHTLTSYRRGKITPHYLDWENQPILHKNYYDRNETELPKHIILPQMNLSDLLAGTAVEPKTTHLSIEDVSRILLLSCTFTAKARYGDGEFCFRSTASAGALYPSEIYVSVEGVKGLRDGLYYFSIQHHSLFLMAEGRVNDSVSELVHPGKGKAPGIILFFTAIFFRSAWKYRERAYRYCLLDTGHLMENVYLALRSCGFSFTFSYDFHDQELNDFLGIDSNREVLLATCQVWVESEDTGKVNKGHISKPGPQFRKRSQVSRKEIEYEAIKDIHSQGTAVLTGAEPQGTVKDLVTDCGMVEKISLPTPETWPEKVTYSEALFNRRSRRNFIKKPLPRDALNSIPHGLWTAGSRYFNGYPLAIGMSIAHDQPITPGFYLLNHDTSALLCIKKGDFISRMASICLDQAWLANAALHTLFLGDLKAVDNIWGPRGYRYALLEAGRMGQRLYLIASALGIGCCGIGAFYDEEAMKLLGLADGVSLLYLVALGPIKAAITGHV